MYEVAVKLVTMSFPGTLQKLVQRPYVAAPTPRRKSVVLALWTKELSLVAYKMLLYYHVETA